MHRPVPEAFPERSNPVQKPFLGKVAFVALLLFTLVGVPAGRTSAQDNLAPPPGKPLDVAAGSEVFTPVPGGRPLAVEIDGKEVRTLFLYEGRSAADVRDPGRVVYYHGLDLALVPRDKPLPGFPAWVQDVTQRDDETVLEVRFRLSSPALRRACEAKLLADQRDFFARERDRLKIPGLKVEVQKIPAKELFVAVQDRATNLTLAYDTQHVANLGEEVLMSFRLKPEAMALFVLSHKEGKLQFKPYYTARLAQIITAEKQTDIDYAVGLKVKQGLDSRQRPADGGKAAYPILQGHVNRIARQVMMDLRSKIVADDPLLLTFLPSDTTVVAVCFEPATALSFADFRKAFPDYTDQMLAEYLKPYGVTRYAGKVDDKSDGGQNTKETAKSLGGGFSLAVPVGPVAVGGSAQAENAERTIETIYNTTGVKLIQNETRQYYEPAEVRVYKLAEAYETKRLAQAGSITLSKGPLNSYLEESPFSQSYTAAVVDASLRKTLEKNDHVTRLLAEKADLEKQWAAAVAKLAAAQVEQVKLLSGVAALPKEVEGHITDLPARFLESIAEDSLRGILTHVDKVWGFKPGVNETVELHMTHREDPSGPTRREKANAAKKLVAEHTDGITAKSKLLGEALAGLTRQTENLDRSQKEIARLQAELEKVDKQIVSILER